MWIDGMITVQRLQGKIHLLLSGWMTEFPTSHNTVQGRISGEWTGYSPCVSVETIAKYGILKTIFKFKR